MNGINVDNFTGNSIAIGFAGMAIICSVILMWDNARQNRQRDAKHGEVLARGKETIDARSGLPVDPFDRARWDLDQNMSDTQIVELGDRHPCESVYGLR